MDGKGIGEADTSDRSPWRPGADVVFDHPSPRSFEPESPPSRPESTTSPGSEVRSRRPWLIPPVVAVVLLGVAVFVSRPDSTVVSMAIAADAGPSAGAEDGADPGGDVSLRLGDAPLLAARSECLPGRLPRTIEPRWSSELPGVSGVAAPIVLDAELAVGVFETDDALELAAVNAADGAQHWAVPITDEIGRVVGIVDDTVIAKLGRGDGAGLHAHDAHTGEPLWARSFGSTWSALIDPVSRLLIVEVEPSGFGDVGVVVAINPATSETLVEVPGAFLGVSPTGRVMTRAGDKVLSAEVPTGDEPSFRDLPGVVAPSDAAFAPVGDALVVDVSSVLMHTELIVSPAANRRIRRLEIVGSGNIQPPASVNELAPLDGSSVLLSGDGAVHGTNIGRETAEIRWRVDGVLLWSQPNDRGRSLVIAQESGFEQTVIDASTGRRIVDIPRRAGALTSVNLLSNGVVVRDNVDGQEVRRAVDLDGHELWTLDGDGLLAVGEGLVVEVRTSPTGEVSIHAFGDDPTSQTSSGACGSIMTTWESTWS